MLVWPRTKDGSVNYWNTEERAGQELKTKEYETTGQEIFHKWNWSDAKRHLKSGSQLMYSSHETLQARFLDSNRNFDSGHTQCHT